MPVRQAYKFLELYILCVTIRVFPIMLASSEFTVYMLVGALLYNDLDINCKLLWVCVS